MVYQHHLVDVLISGYEHSPLQYLPASELVGLLSALHLAQTGMVQADTAGGYRYFAGVDTAHELLGHAKACAGALFEPFRKRWGIQYCR